MASATATRQDYTGKKGERYEAVRRGSDDIWKVAKFNFMSRHSFTKNL